MQNRCCFNGCYLNNNCAQLYFTAGIYCLYTVYMENSLRFVKFAPCTKVSFTLPELLWALMIELPYTWVKFCPGVKPLAGLSSLRVLCKRALILEFFKYFVICGALRDLVPFVQFKKREKHPWRSVNFSKVAGFSLRLY